MRKKSRRFFSLIELMVVLAIVGTISSVIGIKISKAIADHEYISSSCLITEKLKFARRLALVNQSDVYVNFIQKKSKILCSIGFPGGGATPREAKFRHEFSNIVFLFEPEGSPPIEGALFFSFTSGGDLNPKGTLCLSPAKESEKLEEKKIDFKEYFSRDVDMR